MNDYRREQFEHFIKSQTMWSIARRADGAYVDRSTAAHWRTWQVAVTVAEQAA